MVFRTYNEKPVYQVKSTTGGDKGFSFMSFSEEIDEIDTSSESDDDLNTTIYWENPKINKNNIKKFTRPKIKNKRCKTKNKIKNGEDKIDKIEEDPLRTEITLFAVSEESNRLLKPAKFQLIENYYILNSNFIKNSEDLSLNQNCQVPLIENDMVNHLVGIVNPGDDDETEFIDSEEHDGRTLLIPKKLIDPVFFKGKITSRKEWSKAYNSNKTRNKSPCSYIDVQMFADTGSAYNFIRRDALESLKREFDIDILKSKKKIFRVQDNEGHLFSEYVELVLNPFSKYDIVLPFIIYENHKHHPEFLLGRDAAYLGRSFSFSAAPFLKFTRPDSNTRELAKKMYSLPSYKPHEKVIDEFMKNIQQQLLLNNQLDNFSKGSEKKLSDKILKESSFSLNYLEGTDLSKVPARPYAVPKQYVPSFREEVIKMESNNVIAQANHDELGIQLAWTIVNQKDKIRWCLNAVPLNKVIKEPVPNFVDMVALLREKLPNGKYFTRIDLTQAYYNMRWEYQPGELVPYFRFEGKNYKFLRLPFGIKSAPTIFNHFLQRVFNGCEEFMLQYFDDVVIYSDTAEQHIKDVNKVLSIMNQYGLKANPDKCEWCCEYLTFLGHRISEAGIVADPTRIKQILEFTNPKNEKELQSYLGLVNFCRRYFIQIDKATDELYDYLAQSLREKKKWTEKFIKDVKKSFDASKNYLADVIYLNTPPDCEVDEVTIYCDASDTGLGGIIGYWQNCQFKIFDVASRSLMNYECNYNTTKKELCAINYCCTRWDQFLLGRKVQIFSDHAALVHDLQTTALTQRTFNVWWANLARYNIKINHVAGSKNEFADYISRTYTLETNITSEADKVNDIDADYTEPIETVTGLMGLISECDEEVDQHEYATWQRGHDAAVLATFEELGDDDDTTESHISPTVEKTSSKLARLMELVEAEDLDDDESELVKNITNWLRNRVVDTSVDLIEITDPNIRQQMLEEAHKDHAYPQLMRTRLMIRGVTWKGIWRDCNRVASHCDACKRFNTQKLTHSHLRPLTSTAPMEFINFDLLGPITVDANGKVIEEIKDTENKNKVAGVKNAKKAWVLVTVCVNTSYTVMRVLSSKTSKDIINAMASIFWEYGFPARLQSDQAKEFTSEQFAKYVKSIQVRHRLSSTYTPRANGKVERRVGVVKQLLQKLIWTRVYRLEEWCEAIPAIQFYMNSRIDIDTGISPFVLMFGRVPIGVPGSLNYKNIENNFDLSEWLSTWTVIDTKINPAMRLKDKNKKLRYYQKLAHKNDVTHTSELKIGQPVYLKVMSRQFGEGQWAGPYYILHQFKHEDTATSYYKLREAGGNTGRVVAGVYSSEHLKVIKNDSLEKEIDDARWISVIFNTYTYRGKHTEYLVRYVGEDSGAEWVHEDLIGEVIKSRYWEDRKKMNGKNNKKPFSWKVVMDIRLHPLVSGGFDPNLDYEQLLREADLAKIEDRISNIDLNGVTLLKPKDSQIENKYH